MWWQEQSPNTHWENPLQQTSVCAYEINKVVRLVSIKEIRKKIETL